MSQETHEKNNKIGTIPHSKIRLKRVGTLLYPLLAYEIRSKARWSWLPRTQPTLTADQRLNTRLLGPPFNPRPHLAEPSHYQSRGTTTPSSPHSSFRAVYQSSSSSGEFRVGAERWWKHRRAPTIGITMRWPRNCEESARPTKRA